MPDYFSFQPRFGYIDLRWRTIASMTDVITYRRLDHLHSLFSHLIHKVNNVDMFHIGHHVQHSIHCDEGTCSTHTGTIDDNNNNTPIINTVVLEQDALSLLILSIQE